MISPFPGIDGQQGPPQGNGNTPTGRGAKKPDEDDEDEQSSTGATNTDDSIDDAVLDQWG